MNKQEKINQLIDDTLNSLDNIKRASPLPFLLTRINARSNKSSETTWEKAGWFIGRPSIAIAGLAFILFINGMAIVFNKTDTNIAATEQTISEAADEFAYTVPTIYDNENLIP